MCIRDRSHTLWTTGAVVVLTLLIRFLCTTGASRMSYLSSKAVKKTLRERIYEKLLRLGVSYKEQVKTSEVVQVAVEGLSLIHILKKVNRAFYLLHRLLVLAYVPCWPI